MDDTRVLSITRSVMVTAGVLNFKRTHCLFSDQERNKGLFTAGQNLNKDSATRTRQVSSCTAGFLESITKPNILQFFLVIPHPAASFCFWGQSAIGIFAPPEAKCKARRNVTPKDFLGQPLSPQSPLRVNQQPGVAPQWLCFAAQRNSYFRPKTPEDFLPRPNCTPKSFSNTLG